MSDVYLKLYDRVGEMVGLEEGEYFGPGDCVVLDIGLDSLDAVELIMWLEEEFDIDINEYDLEDDYSLYNIADYIEKQIGEV